MALTLVLTFGTPCAGGNHFALTGTLTPGGARTIQTSRQELARAVTNEDLEAFARVLMRLYRNQLPVNATNAQIKTAIEGKTLDLTVT